MRFKRPWGKHLGGWNVIDMRSRSCDWPPRRSPLSIYLSFRVLSPPIQVALHLQTTQVLLVWLKVRFFFWEFFTFFVTIEPWNALLKPNTGNICQECHSVLHTGLLVLHLLKDSFNTSSWNHLRVTVAVPLGSVTLCELLFSISCIRL